MNRTLTVFCATAMTAVFSTAVMAADVTRHTPVAAHAAQVGGLPLIMVAQAGSSNTDALMLLLDQFQSMRSELEVLRGMVEEQGYDIRRLQQDSLDRYTDLDSRISVLYQDMENAGAPAAAGVSQTAPGAGVNPAPLPGDSPAAQGATNANNVGADARNVAAAASQPGAGSPAGSAANTTAANTTAATGANLATSQLPPVGMLTEQQLYELALDSLLQQEAYERSIAEFDVYLTEYPNGRFVTNAYYWQGQAYVNLSMFNEARDAFEIILNDYPDGRKIEDAMYSLGTVYHRLGDAQRARQLLLDVRTRFPNTSAANLADIYLRSL